MADSLANVDWFLVGIAIITPVLLTGMNYVVYRFYAAEDMKGNWLSYIFLVSACAAHTPRPSPSWRG